MGYFFFLEYLAPQEAGAIETMVLTTFFGGAERVAAERGMDYFGLVWLKTEDWMGFAATVILGGSLGVEPEVEVPGADLGVCWAEEALLFFEVTEFWWKISSLC